MEQGYAYCETCLKILWPDPVNVHTCTPHPAAKELTDLRADNQRLREALERIAGVEPWDRFLAEHTRVSIARAALKVDHDPR